MINYISSEYINIFLSSFVLCSLITFLCVITKKYHKSFSSDSNFGPQKIHNNETIRIGGVAIFISLLISIFFIPSNINKILMNILISASPAFLSGLVEDTTKKVSPYARLSASLISGILFVYMSDITIKSIGIEYFNSFLEIDFLNLFFTIICISLFIQSINIIDGLNGLSLGCVIIMCVSMLLVCIKIGDYFIFSLLCLFLGCFLGAIIFNFPKCFIFMGDGGAYLIGAIVAFITIILIDRNTQVSPFYCCLILIYPIYETIRSFVRRLSLGLHTSFHPDNEHLHSLLYKFVKIKYGFLSSNSFASFIILLFQSIFAVMAYALFDNTLYLLVIIFIFIVTYEMSYSMINKYIKIDLN